jgi:hypothetical protein
MARQKRILNFSENVLNIKLNKALEGSKLKVGHSVSMSEVIDISRDELDEAEFDFYLKTNFDFLITDDEYNPVFVVEFDGPVHARPKKIRNDKMKNSMLEMSCLPYLRIDQDLLHKKIDKYDLIDWIIRLFLSYIEYQKSKERGEIPPDEPWFFGNVVNFDPFIKYRSFPMDWQNKGIIRSGLPYYITLKTDNNYFHTFTYYEFKKNKWICGESKCRVFKFPAISAWELSKELSAFTAVENIKSQIDKKDKDLISTAEIVEKRKKLLPTLYKEGGQLIV